MSNELAASLASVARSRNAADHPTGANVPQQAHNVALVHDRPRSTFRSNVKAGLTWAIRSILVNIGLIIVWLWLRGGGISSAHNAGTFLTTVGRISGLFGAYLLLIQVLLLARLPFMEWVAGFDRLTRWHRLNGKLALGLILAHIGFITTGYALMDKISVPAEVSSLLGTYPGMIAALIGSIMLVLVVVTSLVIVRRRLRYEAWFLVHLLAYAGIFLAWFHQLPTGNEFVTHPWAAAFWIALYAVTLQFVVLFRVGKPIVRGLWHRLRVAEVIEEGPGVVSLRITGHHLDWMYAHAGQFFNWRFLDRERWHESHPFSLSAAPDGKSLRITVKALGDFSSRIGQIKPGTRVIAEGPFGSFTDEARRRNGVALIAGGVGITPIRALLEEMDGDLVLVYRVARDEDLIFRHELAEMARERGITIHYLLGDHKSPDNKHLLSPAHMCALIPDIAHRDIYLCGPHAMMSAVKKNLRRLGVPAGAIHTDEFAF